MKPLNYTFSGFFCFINMKFEINIPTSLDEITLRQYQQYIAIENPTEEDALRTLLGLDLKDLGKLKQSSVDVLISSLNELFSKQPHHRKLFKFDGVLWGFIPKLDDITYGENKDVTTYLKWDTMHKAMATLYRPVTIKKDGKYLIEEYEGVEKYEDKMLDMPVSICMGAMVFFCDLTNDLLKAIPNYLERVAQLQGLEENGEAIKKFIPLLKETLQDLKPLQNFHFTNA